MQKENLYCIDIYIEYL